ncbi:SUMF1/EgtB/PvdO family nonheme iron enzyme [bacterium]|nr:SUMF1/EgtB/PvdO family nonheme iron enzyme [bacterium]
MAVTMYNAAEGCAQGSNRVKRGGSWNNNARNCRSANRNRNNPSNTNNNIGFRVVRNPYSNGESGHRVFLFPCGNEYYTIRRGW